MSARKIIAMLQSRDVEMRRLGEIYYKQLPVHDSLFVPIETIAMWLCFIDERKRGVKEFLNKRRTLDNFNELLSYFDENSDYMTLYSLNKIEWAYRKSPKMNSLLDEKGITSPLPKLNIYG